jgi:monosaccharide-transporting ATPase
MGENGAGKSTLIKVLTGFHSADSGEIRLSNRTIRPDSPRMAQQLGISTVYQEINLIPSLSIAENIALGRQPRGFFGLDWKATRSRAETAIARLGLKLDVTSPLQSHSVAVQQMVAIARALDLSSSVLILDEPTASLDADEVKRLFEVMRKLRSDGMAILFVTHFLDQVYEISDRITVLRNGQTIGEYRTPDLPRGELVARMMGLENAQELASGFKEAIPRTDKTAILEMKRVARKGSVLPIDLSLFRGETVGLAGLLGSGRSEIARLIFGIEPADAGEQRLNGKPTQLKNPRVALRSKIGLIPEDRKTQGILPDLSIRENLILALQVRRGWLRRIHRKEQLEICERFTKALKIVASGPEQPIGTLSGGNQQKVVLARWLASEPEILLLDEPTRGIDVGAKTQVQKLVQELAAQGMAILFISSELEEIVACSHRVVVLRDGHRVGELEGDRVRESAILSMIAEGEYRD